MLSFIDQVSLKPQATKHEATYLQPTW